MLYIFKVSPSKAGGFLLVFVEEGASWGPLLCLEEAIKAKRSSVFAASMLLRE